MFRTNAMLPSSPSRNQFTASLTVSSAVDTIRSSETSEFSCESVDFEVFARVVINNSVFWDIMSYSPLKVTRRFGGISYPSSGSKNEPTG
jgi:hypothetical protein